MNNTTEYHSLDYWLDHYGSMWHQEITFLILLPIGLIGFILNLMALCVYQRREFETMPIYDYLRFYTANSAVICLLISTRFINRSRRFFNFANTSFAMNYFAHFYIPVLNFAYFYGSCLDILLTLDRIALFSNEFQFFKVFKKPKKICIILMVISFLFTIDFWFLSSVSKVELKLNATQVFVMYHLASSRLNHDLAIHFTNLIVNIIPIIIEVPLNISTILLLRAYMRRRKNIGIVKFVMSKERNTSDTSLFDEQSNKEFKQKDKAKKLELKVTFLIIFMSFLSLM
jgi:hypothetical protein